MMPLVPTCKKGQEEGEMVQRLRALASKPDHLSSKTGTHMVEGEKNWLFSNLHTHKVARELRPRPPPPKKKQF